MSSFSIWHWLILLVPALIAVLFWYHAKRGNGLTGKRGWLLFLIISWMILTPLVSFGWFVFAFSGAEIENSKTATHPTFVGMKWSIFAVHLATACAYSWAGWGLATGNTWAVVVRAQLTLWFTAPLFLVLYYVVVPLVFLGVTMLDISAVATSVVMFICVCFWSAYLARSERVKLSFGERDREVAEMFR